jgi:hypothetical protein
LCPRRTTHSAIERISNTCTVWSLDTLASSPMWSPCERLGRVPCWCPGPSCQHASPVPLERVRDTYSVVCTVPFRESQNLIRLSYAARHKEAHRWVPFDAFDVPTVAGKDLFLSTLREGPYAHGRVVTDSGKLCIALRETDMYSFSMCRPRGQVIHVRLEIL